MTQKAIAELYQSTKQNISLHIKNIFEEKELDEDLVVKFYLTTARDGKNYLSEKELNSLNRIVTMYLDYAEDQAERQSPMYMNDWIDKFFPCISISLLLSKIPT